MSADRPDPQEVARLVTQVVEDVSAVSLVGSAAVSGLRPDSDLDILVLLERSMAMDQRRALVRALLRHSGRRAELGPSRPVELTALVVADVVPWRYPARRDFLYGEWLRASYQRGLISTPEVDPNLPVLVTSACDDAVPLVGPHPRELLETPSFVDIRSATADCLPQVHGSLVGDERNVLLTLARMLTTLQTGQIVEKDEAAEQVIPQLSPHLRPMLERAAAEYNHGSTDDDLAWDPALARDVADQLVVDISRAGERH